MASDVSIVIADATRLPAMRASLELPGRVMHFAATSLGSAIESMRAYRPKLVAIDAIFAETSSGTAFIERVEGLRIAGCTIQLVVEREEDRWVTMPRGAVSLGTQSQKAAGATNQPGLVAPSPSLSVAKTVAAAVPVEAVNTRRAPRFAVRGSLEAVVESGLATLVDISVLGAQVVSLAAIRPRQKINIALPDTDDQLNVLALVAWSMFEKPPSQSEPHYRVGLEFTGAAQQALEAYRQRHCADRPIPLRGR